MLSMRPLGRTAPRAARTLRAPRVPQRRFQSTSSTVSQTNASSSASSSHFAAGLAGGVAGASILYGIYYMSPSGRVARKFNKAAAEADKKYQQAAATLKEKTPSTDQAVDKVKEFCYAYVVWVPGGRQYVDVVFKDFDTIREKHGDEVDKLVADTYGKFQGIAKSGLSLESASKAYDALADLGRELAKLAGSAADQILENHPQLKEKVGGPIDQLKEMGEQYGPEAKKMVDDTWNQVSEVVSGGVSAENIDRARKIIEEKVQQLKKFGDQAWQKALEQGKPYLDKNPQVKKLIEENQDMLKQGNATELFNKVKEAVESGNIGNLEDYVKKAADKAKSSTGMGMGTAGSLMGGGSFTGLAQLLGSSSQDAAGKIQNNIEVLKEVMNNHSSEGKQLLEETRDDLKRVLEDKAKKAREIVESAQKQKA
ncbi:hypothetical protein QBC47DRAFT_379951 [Echria macrotheca]|uniref:Uncharacterized protein n=1 Tax=Echria macrotheca TaxID=438768 RepID=A0AAJ0BG10_9PEZI|nr:hypothetical protein QBC47DRAFT_379951 [Echria macrotheca]